MLTLGYSEVPLYRNVQGWTQAGPEAGTRLGDLSTPPPPRSPTVTTHHRGRPRNRKAQRGRAAKALSQVPPTSSRGHQLGMNLQPGPKASAATGNRWVAGLVSYYLKLPLP